MAYQKKAKHVVAVKMFLAITFCFMASYLSVVIVIILQLDPKFAYSLFINNLCNPLIYYWLNTEFREQYNAFWGRFVNKLCKN